MGIALAARTVKPTRVQPADVETAQERVPAIHDEKLAVVVLKISQRVSEIKGTKPAKPHAASFQFPPKLVEIPMAGSESVEMQLDIKPGSRLGCERGDKTRPDFVGDKDVGFHPYRFGRALDRRDHRIEESISLGKQLDPSPRFGTQIAARACGIVRGFSRGARELLMIAAYRPTGPVATSASRRRRHACNANSQGHTSVRCPLLHARRAGTRHNRSCCGCNCDPAKGCDSEIGRAAAAGA